MRRLLLLVALLLAVSVSPAFAASRPPRPTVSVHYVYNCTNPTIEVTFKNLSGVKDVYAHGDYGYDLVAEDFNFDKTKVYDGLYHLGAVYQMDVFVTAPNAGPYASHLAGGSTAATSQCPTYYPDYNSHWVNPTPPAGSVPITLAGTGQWWPSD
jgi:hypothetical protein